MWATGIWPDNVFRPQKRFWVRYTKAASRKEPQNKNQTPTPESYYGSPPKRFCNEIGGFETSALPVVSSEIRCVPRHPPRRHRSIGLCTRENVWMLLSSIVCFLVSSGHETVVKRNRCFFFWGGGAIVESVPYIYIYIFFFPDAFYDKGCTNQYFFFQGSSIRELLRPLPPKKMIFGEKTTVFFLLRFLNLGALRPLPPTKTYFW